MTWLEFTTRYGFWFISEAWFLSKLKQENLIATSPLLRKRVQWGIEFQNPSFTIFSSGDFYDISHAQGAGAYAVGPIAFRARKGVLGLEQAVEELKKVKKRKGCPLGVSLLLEENLQNTIDCLWRLEALGVDWIELQTHLKPVAMRLKYKKSHRTLVECLSKIEHQFLRRLNRKLPLLIKVPPGLEISYLVEYLHDKEAFSGLSVGSSHWDNLKLEEALTVWTVKEYFERFSKYGHKLYQLC
jgi:hypothetical protein